MVNSDSDHVVIRAGARFGCEMRIGAPTEEEAREILHLALSSISVG